MVPKAKLKAKQREMEDHFGPLMIQVAKAFAEVEAGRDIVGLRWLTECLGALVTNTTHNLCGDKGKPVAAGHEAIH